MFPYEYQTALKDLAAKSLLAEVSNGNSNGEREHTKSNISNGIINNIKAEPSVKDIEETIQDFAIEEKRLDNLLDKTR